MVPATQYVTASAWPHDHTYEYGGPLDFRIGYRSQPKVVRNWPKRWPLRMNLSQPDERTNLTVCRIGFNAPGSHTQKKDEHWYSVNSWRRADNTLTIYVKVRVVKSVPHPIPVGKWSGTCECTDEWALFTLQQMTLRVKQPEKKIVLPDMTAKKSKGGIILP